MVFLITGPRWPALKWNKSDYNQKTQDDFFSINGFPVFTLVNEQKNPEINRDFDKLNVESPQILTPKNEIDFGREHTTKTSKVIWDSSIVLSKYIESISSLSKIDLKSKKVLELGAGKGLVGISCALLGGVVTLSDAPEAISGLKNVVRINELHVPCIDSDISRGYVENVVALDWLTCFQESPLMAASKPTFDFIVASDVIWVDWLVEPFIKTLSGFMDSNTTVAYLAYQKRGAQCHPIFLRCMKENGLEYEIVPFKDLHPRYQLGATIDIYVIKKATT